MFGVGIPELIVILVVALVVLGPERLPEVARGLGKALGELRRATSGLTGELKEVQRSFQEESRAIARSAEPRPRPAPPAMAPDAPAAPPEAPKSTDD